MHIQTHLSPQINFKSFYIYLRKIYKEIPRILHEGVIHYLIGQFYINLNVIWDEVVTILKTFSGDMGIFWPVFREHLVRSEIIGWLFCISYY